LHHDGEPFSGGTQQRRWLKEETIPHIIHQVGCPLLPLPFFAAVEQIPDAGCP
jgi:hypothetical protein